MYILNSLSLESYKMFDTQKMLLKMTTKREELVFLLVSILGFVFFGVFLLYPPILWVLWIASFISMLFFFYRIYFMKDKKEGEGLINAVDKLIKK